MSESNTKRGPDILQRTAPALSATADEPLAGVALPPVAASNNQADQDAGTASEMSPEDGAAAAKAKVDGAPTMPPEEPPKPPEGPPDPAPAETIEVDGKKVEPPPWMKKELAKTRERQRLAEEKALRESETVATMAREIEELKAKLTPPPEEPKPDPRPARDQFQTPELYDEALTGWAEREGERKAAARVAAEKAAADKQAADKARADAQKAMEAESQRLNQLWVDRKTKALEKHPDLEEKIARPDISISVPMAHAILMAENGPEVAYYLADHPDEAARISGLKTDGEHILAIGKLSQQLNTPPPARTRSQPISPLTGNSSPADTSARELTMEEWAAKRTPEILANRKPFINPPPPGPRRTH